jgi:hypothetical protein
LCEKAWYLLLFLAVFIRRAEEFSVVWLERDREKLAFFRQPWVAYEYKQFIVATMCDSFVL